MPLHRRTPRCCRWRCANCAASGSADRPRRREATFPLTGTLSPSATGRHFHAAYIQYARWLVGGLTFQLAADIVESAFSPSWDEIGRLAAIAVIRTFVNYFLERDLAEVEKREAATNMLVVADKAP